MIPIGKILKSRKLNYVITHNMYTRVSSDHPFIFPDEISVYLYQHKAFSVGPETGKYSSQDFSGEGQEEEALQCLRPVC